MSEACPPGCKRSESEHPMLSTPPRACDCGDAANWRLVAGLGCLEGSAGTRLSSAGVRAFRGPTPGILIDLWLALHYTSPVLAYACPRQLQGGKHQHRLILGVARPIPSDTIME